MSDCVTPLMGSVPLEMAEALAWAAERFSTLRLRLRESKPFRLTQAHFAWQHPFPTVLLSITTKFNPSNFRRQFVSMSFSYHQVDTNCLEDLSSVSWFIFALAGCGSTGGAVYSVSHKSVTATDWKVGNNVVTSQALLPLDNSESGSTCILLHLRVATAQ